MTAAERYSSRSRGRVPDGAANSQVNGGDGGVDVQDVFHVLSTSPTAGRAARLLRLQDRLGDRDPIVLHALAALRWMTGHQLQRLVFATGSPHTQGLRTRRCLLRLHRLGLLARAERHVGGPRGGSTSYTYHLSGEGQRLVGTRPNRPSRILGARDHALAVSEVAVTLHEAHRTGTLELVRFEAEPVCWRSFTIDASRRYLRPDAFVILAAGEWERLWFIELDRGTQPASTICRKTHAYTAYATTGQEQDRWGVFPRVAFLTLDPARRDALDQRDQSRARPPGRQRPRRRCTRHRRPAPRRRPGPRRTRPQPRQGVSVTTPPRPPTRRPHNRQRTRRTRGAPRSSRHDPARRVREVVDQAPALTADQLSQLRDLLAAPPRRNDDVHAD